MSYMCMTSKQQDKTLIIIFLLSGGAGNTNHIPRCLTYTHVLPSCANVLDVFATYCAFTLGLSLGICLFNFRKSRHFCRAAAGGNKWEVAGHLEEFVRLCFNTEPKRVSFQAVLRRGVPTPCRSLMGLLCLFVL